MSGDIALLGKHGQKLDITLLSEEDKINSILRWSALPGGGKHHWGTDFDVYDRGALSDGTVLKLNRGSICKDIKNTFITG